jgi:hypothetical protein
MKNIDFASKWEGPPMVVAPDAALMASALTPECREFLGTIGLPSNALWPLPRGPLPRGQRQTLDKIVRSAALTPEQPQR